MAGTNVQYIIDLIVSDKQLRTQMSKLDWEEILGSGGKDFGKTLAKGAKEAEQNIKSTLGNIDWSSLLGEKEVTRLERVVSKVITANAEKIKTIGRDGDTSGIQNIIDLVSALGNELKEVGSSFDAPSLARSVNNFMKVLAPISAKIDSLAKEPEKISAAFDRALNDNFAEGINYLNSLGLNVDFAQAFFNSLPLVDEQRLNSISNIASMLVKYILLENMLKPDLSQNMQRTIKYIDENLDKPLSVKRISKDVNVSKSVLYKNFHSRFNCTLSEYINSQRIERSTLLLLNTDLSVDEISQKVGFSNASYFSKTFKKQMGTSPLKYRKTKLED